MPWLTRILTRTLGFDTEAKAIRDALSNGDFSGMFKAVADDMVAALALAGTPADVRRRRGEFDGLADNVILYSPDFGVSREETIANHEAVLEAFAGYGIKLWTLWQDLSQVKSIYGERWESFFSNAGLLQSFATQDVSGSD
jgi:hypothetical protein